MPGHSWRSRIGEDCLEGYRPGGGIRLVVDCGERAGIELGLAVRAQCDRPSTGPFASASCTSGMSVAANVNITLIGCTWLITTRAFGSLGRAPCRARVNDVADIEQTNSGDAVEWSHQFRIAQLGLGIFDRRLIGFDRRLFLSDHRLLGGDLLLRRKSLFLQWNIAAEIDLSIFEMGLVAGEIGLGLVELRLIGARIELGQELALLDKLAVLEVDADDRSCDHAADRRRIERRHIADPGQYDRKIAFGARLPR